MKHIFLIFYLLHFATLTAQSGFSDGATLIDMTHRSADATSIASADLNNDGKKELLVASRYDNSVMFYKNINGLIQQNQRVLLYVNVSTNHAYYDICTAYLDDDALMDIIVAHTGGSIIWFRNLGNFNFSPPISIATSLGSPKSVCAGDLDNDGDIDIVSGQLGADNVMYWLNDGSGNFSTPQIVQETDYGVEEVKLFDLDNNGYLDIVSAQENGDIYWKKNFGGTSFGPAIFVTGNAHDGTGFDFVKANGDNFYDIVFCDNYFDKVKVCYNMGGNSFSFTVGILDNAISDPRYLVAADMNNDGLQDIVVSKYTDDAIGWYQNNGGSFSGYKNITSNVSNPYVFVVEDLDSDGKKEVITSSYSSEFTHLQKVAMFEYTVSPPGSVESVLNFNFSVVNCVKVADINNDGNNDIISGYGRILWSENLGGATFSSQKLIASPTGPNTINFDMELTDLNADGFKDIIAVNSGVEVYRNNGNETFTKLYTAPFTTAGSREMELADLDGDGDLDILLTFIGSVDPLRKMMNLGNFTFGPMQPISASLYGYRPNKIKCADMDNDGDQDIVASSEEYARIHLLENDGSGQFTCHLIRDEVLTRSIVLTDIDHDNFVDIVSAAGYNYDDTPVYSIANTGNNTFGPTVVFDMQSVKALEVADLNNDGFDDIVGTSYEYYDLHDEKVFYYLNNGASFGNKTIVESLGNSLSLDRNLALGDLNNDNKIDIVSSYYMIHTVKYFLNESVLETQSFEMKDAFSLFPNPAKDQLFWNGGDLTKIGIYNLLGQIILSPKPGEGRSIDVSSLHSGIYIFKGYSPGGVKSVKFVKE